MLVQKIKTYNADLFGPSDDEILTNEIAVENANGWRAVQLLSFRGESISEKGIRILYEKEEESKT